jgi:membrane-associated phospholipid phosphatase
MDLPTLVRLVALPGSVGYVLVFIACCLLPLLIHIDGRRHALRWLVALTSVSVLQISLRIALNGDPFLDSFPSGHVVLATVAAGGLLGLLGWQTKQHRTLALFGAVVIALVVGLSRVTNTPHRWIDVLGGLVLTLACLALTGFFWLPAGPDAGLRKLLRRAALGGVVLAALVGPFLDPVIRAHAPY